MKALPLEIKSYSTAIELLSTAIYLRNMPLVSKCVEFLDKFLDRDNVLSVYSFISRWNEPNLKNEDFQPSAPPIVENVDQQRVEWLEEILNRLRYNCLLLIDKNADYILSKKEIFDLKNNELVDILKRDTLEISNEVIVYKIMYLWWAKECNRNTWEPQNIKYMPQEMRYVARYGLMSKKDFLSRKIDGVKGPTKSGILEEKEWRRIRFYIEEKSKGRPVESLSGKMSQPRIKSTVSPFILSSRTKKNSTISENTRKKSKSDQRPKCEKFLLNFLTCWTAVFD